MHHRDVPYRLLVAAAIGVAVLGLSGCGGSGSTDSASASSAVLTSAASSTITAAPVTESSSAASSGVIPTPAPGPVLTGYGTTPAQWNATHQLDPSVPAGNAYLPKVYGANDPRTDTWQEVIFGDHVTAYTVNITPTTSFPTALARARQELPVDAKLLWSAAMGTCYQAEFQSATLASVLGDKYSMVVIGFDNADTAEISPITEEIFDPTDTATQADASPC